MATTDLSIVSSLDDTTSASRLAKSNRAQGDLFELLVIKHLVKDLARRPGLGSPEFNYSSDLSSVTAQVKNSSTKESNRYQNQLSRVASAKDAVLDLISSRVERLGPVSKIIWTGRNRDITTTADVLVVHTTKSTGLSLKSVAQGTGTLRNLGANGPLLRRFISEANMTLDFAALNPMMVKYSKAALRDLAGPARLAALSTPRSIRRKLLTDAERAACAPIGREMSDLLASLFAVMFDSLSDALRGALLRELLGKPSPDVFTLIANDKSSYITQTPPSPGLIALSRDPADSNRGLWITVADKKAVRLEFNCSNGLGISPLVVRSFTP